MRYILVYHIMIASFLIVASYYAHAVPAPHRVHLLVQWSQYPGFYSRASLQWDPVFHMLSSSLFYWGFHIHKQFSYPKIITNANTSFSVPNPCMYSPVFCLQQYSLEMSCIFCLPLFHELIPINASLCSST